MSLTSALENARIAKDLKTILVDAAKGKEWGDNRSVVKAFARKHILPEYIVRCADSIGIEKVDEEILDWYK